MAKIVKRRRGSSADHATFTGSEGELTVDLTEKTVRVHDGSTQAGFPLARKDMSNVSGTVGIEQLTVSDGNPDQILKTDGSGNLSFTDAPDVSGSAIGGDLTGTIGNAQIGANKVGVSELNLSDGTNGQVLQTNGSGTLSFVGLSGDISGTIDNTQIGTNKVGIGELNVTDGTSGQVLATNGSGDLFFTTNTGGGGGGSSNFVEDVFVADGTTTYGPFSVAAPLEESILVFIDGVNQPTTAYTLPTTTTIAFTTAVTTGQKIRVVHLGIANQILDNSVNGTKIAMGADVAGDTLYYDGTDYRKLSIGTAGQVLSTNAGATAPEWISPTTVQYDQAFTAGFNSSIVKQDVAVQSYGKTIMARAGTFTGEVGYIETPAVGSALICDIEKNGVSIYSTKPQFNASAYTITAGVLSTNSFAAGDRIVFKVTQIGSGTAGQGVCFSVKCTATA